MSDANKVVRELFQGLRKREFIPEEDIAWVGVCLEFLDDLEGEAFLCPIRDVLCKKFEGVEFRVSQWATHDHTHLNGRFAWNITKRTKDLFNWDKPKGQK